ncbi:MAG: hypothetical protein ACXW5U_08130 [Thermoanaerobaculia bacterium]
MNTLICAGGSAQRVLTAVLQLCAAGLGPDEIRILVVDPDGANGNGSDCRHLVDLYMQCRERFAGKLGPGIDLFNTKLDLLDDKSLPTGVKVWSPVTPRDTLGSVINYDNLSPKAAAAMTPPDVAHLFFTREEIEMPLDQGFKGHTSVGAAAMSLVAQRADEQPWKQITDKIRQDVTSTRGSAVAVVGSVFGGTGASAIHPIVRFLRATPETNHDRLHIAAIAIAPYFRFDPSTATAGTAATDSAAKAEWFPLRTRSAVDYYKHLEDNREFDFDAIFWVGDNSPTPVGVYAEGGPNQRNPAHFVDLVAALAVLDYFQDPASAKGNYFAGSRTDAQRDLGKDERIDWLDLPFRNLKTDAVKWRALRMVLAGAMHTGFFKQLFDTEDLDQRPSCVRWYYRRFARKGDHFSRQANRDDLQLLTTLFRDYYLPWWRQITVQKDVLFLNNTVFNGDGSGPVDVHLDRLRNIYGEDRPAERSENAIDDFVQCMDDVPARKGGAQGVASYLSLLTHAAELYLERIYRISNRS